MMNPKKGNQNGCKERIRDEDESINNVLEGLQAYVCDELCWFREEMKKDDLMDRICGRCELQQYTDRIREEYEKINNFDKSSTCRFMDKYRKITLCKDCRYCGGINKPHCVGKMSGIAGVLTDGDGCSRGEKK